MTRSALTPSTADPEDFPALVTLLARAGLAHADLTSAHLADFLVLRDDHGLRGAVGLEVHGGDALLRSLVVTPERRGEGLGGRLVEAAEAHARARSVRTLYLLTETAAPFFAARGYVPTDRVSVPTSIRATAEFAALCPASAACLTKRLGASS